MKIIIRRFFQEERLQNYKKIFRTRTMHYLTLMCQTVWTICYPIIIITLVIFYVIMMLWCLTLTHPNPNSITTFGIYLCHNNLLTLTNSNPTNINHWSLLFSHGNLLALTNPSPTSIVTLVIFYVMTALQTLIPLVL